MEYCRCCILQGDRSRYAILWRAANCRMETIFRVWVVTKLSGSDVPCNCCSTASREKSQSVAVCFYVSVWCIRKL